MTQKAGQKCTAIRRVLVPGRARRPRARRPGRPPAARSPSATPRTRACAWGRWPPRRSSRTCARASDQLARDGRLVFGSADVKPVGVPRGQGLLRLAGAGRGRAGRAGARPCTRARCSARWPRVVPYAGTAGGRGGARGARPRRPGLLRLLRGHRLHRRPRARHRAVPRPRLPRQREDRRGLARARAPCCPCSCTAAPAAPAAARSWAACAASPSTCSASPSKARGRSSSESPARVAGL